MTTTVPTAGDEERLVAALREHRGLGAAMAPTFATGKHAAALMDEAAATITRLRQERDEARRRRDEWRKKARGFDEVRLALREKVGAPWPPNLSRALWAGLAADERKRADDAEAALSASNAEAERLREALSELEAANEDLAATRSQKTYLQMVDGDGATDALIRLDLARERARALQGSAKQ